MTYFWLVIIGLAGGASGGLLGIGGSAVMIPGLVLLLGPDKQHLYQAAAMIVNFFVVGPAVLRHTQVRAMLRPVTRWMIPSAIVGAVLGVFVSELPMFRGSGQGYLQITFAAFLAYVIAYNLIRLGSGHRFQKMTEADSAKLSKSLIVAAVGLPSGLLGGLLGVGGGLVAVPAQQVALRIPLTNAIANSASTILWSSVVGAIAKNSRLTEHGFTIRESLMLALCLVPSAMIASYFTAAKVHRWPVRVIRYALVALLLYSAYLLATKGWAQAHG
ncbi:MAG: sulfite exporter TauE/SafE family protein [Planctomycetia bacterium]|jgi:uncharacterized membrane protein YfcA|nr:sulfite exporter TauE/SafE family protein [Planctomycetia bacterium]OQY99902.1 MAG: hypothetical protein B6D36_15780 [Planctomycetes bacterium UTPLA1]